MTTHESKRAVLLYQVYLIFSEPLFWGPVVILSLQTLAHMSLSRIFLMEAVVILVLVVCTIPAGALADVIGKKRAVLLGRVFLVLSVVLFMTMQSEVQAWAGNIAWALGYALISSAESSLLYEILAVRGIERTFKRVQGRAVGTRFLVAAFTSLSVGFLAEIHPRLPLMISLPGMVFALVLVCFMRETSQTKTYSASAQYKVLCRGTAFVLRTPVVLWMIGFAALVTVVSKVWFFLYNPYFELVAVPLTHYGFIFFLVNIVAWLSSLYTYKIEEVLGESTLIVVSLATLALPLCIMALFPTYAAAYLVLAQNVVRGFIRPFTEDFVHHHVTAGGSSTESRATIMAVKSTGTQLASVVGLASAALLLDVVSVRQLLGITAAVCIVLGVVAIYFYRRLMVEKT